MLWSLLSLYPQLCKFFKLPSPLWCIWLDRKISFFGGLTSDVRMYGASVFVANSVSKPSGPFDDAAMRITPALCMMQSHGPFSFNSFAKFLVASVLLKSQINAPSEPGHAFSASAALCAFRPWRVTRCPLLTRAFPTRDPNPSDEPVMKIFKFDMSHATNRLPNFCARTHTKSLNLINRNNRLALKLQCGQIWILGMVLRKRPWRHRNDTQKDLTFNSQAPLVSQKPIEADLDLIGPQPWCDDYRAVLWNRCDCNCAICPKPGRVWSEIAISNNSTNLQIQDDRPAKSTTVSGWYVVRDWSRNSVFNMLFDHKSLAGKSRHALRSRSAASWWIGLANLPEPIKPEKQCWSECTDGPDLRQQSPSSLERDACPDVSASGKQCWFCTTTWNLSSSHDSTTANWAATWSWQLQMPFEIVFFSIPGWLTSSHRWGWTASHYSDLWSINTAMSVERSNITQDGLLKAKDVFQSLVIVQHLVGRSLMKGIAWQAWIDVVFHFPQPRISDIQQSSTGSMSC